MTSIPEQITIPCVLMRGGTSKGLYFHEQDLPPAGADRDRLLKRAMGSPDVMQIDGLGGSRLVTSKVAIIRRSTRDDADIDYTFGQVDIGRDVIGYDGNCGNISAGVGPFAIDENLVDAVEPITTIRIYNTNTDKVLIARVPVSGGKARVLGNCAIAGVPGTGAEILMDYTNTVGAKTGRLLPSGHNSDQIMLESGVMLEATLCDAGNPCIFVAASALGLSGYELPETITANQPLIDTIAEIQAKVIQALGLCKDWRQALRLPNLPLFVMVAAAGDYVDMNGEAQAAPGMDLSARLVFLGKCHESMAGTGSMCTAAASRVPGSVVNKILSTERSQASTLRIGHPLGIMEVSVETDHAAPGAQTPAEPPAEPRFTKLGFTRTARRLMQGALYLPNDTTRTYA